MNYEERVVGGVLCWRGDPAEEWTPMTAEWLTALVLELRQREAKRPVFVPQPYPPVPPGPILHPWPTLWPITCGT